MSIISSNSKKQIQNLNKEQAKTPALYNKGKENLHYLPKWRSFTFNNESFINASEKETTLLMRNPNMANYWLMGRLSIRQTLTTAEHKQHYKQFAKQLRKQGIVLYWVREDNGEYGSNEWHIHYHFIIIKIPALYNKGKENLHKLIRQCIPYTIRPSCEVWIKENDLPWISWIRYILKAKTSTEHDGEYIADKHKQKRKLFPKCGLKKIGFIGNFWAKSKSELWKEVIKEQQIRATDPNYQAYKQQQAQKQQRLEELQEAKKREIVRLWQEELKIKMDAEWERKRQATNHPAHLDHQQPHLTNLTDLDQKQIKSVSDRLEREERTPSSSA